MADYSELVRLHTEEVRAYREYVSAMNGETVLPGHRISERKVTKLRETWLAANRDAIAGGVTAEWRREFLHG